jgi:hypothetical protein
VAPRSLDAATIDVWLADLGLAVLARAERDGVSSWDLELDGLRRPDIRLTIILDPARALLLWVHYAPALGDAFRVSYRQLLRWNDALAFVKFGLGADDRLVLASELAPDGLTGDDLGRAVCRLLTVCDLTLERAAAWLEPGSRTPPELRRPSRQAALFERYAEEVSELLAGAIEDAP